MNVYYDVFSGGSATPGMAANSRFPKLCWYGIFYVGIIFESFSKFVFVLSLREHIIIVLSIIYFFPYVTIDLLIVYSWHTVC